MVLVFVRIVICTRRFFFVEQCVFLGLEGEARGSLAILCAQSHESSSRSEARFVIYSLDQIS
jgi:hypothetical protein